MIVRQWNGDGDFQWSATVDQPWIRLDTQSSNTPSNIIVIADPTNLPVGTHIGHITIAAQGVANSPQVVSVSLKIVAAFLSGRVTDSTGAGVAGVVMRLTGAQAATVQTSSDGTYSFGSVLAGGTYTVSASKLNYTFSPSNQVLNNLVGSQEVFFKAAINQGVPVLISEIDSTRAIALDSVLHIRQPFPLEYSMLWGSDRRTRLMLFAMNFEFTPNEDLSAITADAEDLGHRIYPLTVEYVGKVPGLDWLNSIVVRLPDDISDVGDVLVRITYKGIQSNRVRVGIGHIGDGPPDDIGAAPTPIRQPQ